MAMQLCPTCRRCLDDSVSLCPSPGHAPLRHQRAGTRIINQRYRLDYLLDSGGMGSVYQATHLELNRLCAVKIEHLDRHNFDRHNKQRLRREALVSCKLDHPNVVRIYDFGSNVVTVLDEHGEHSSEELFIAMELLHGLTLRQFLTQHGRLEPADALLIARQVAEGLAELHAQGVIHRDLKPANLMLTLDRQGQLVVKIIDFGAVKLVGPQTTSDHIDLTGHLFIGSARYASPEMCRAEPLDTRSDLYILGLVLYEMIAGRPAFTETDFATLVYNHAWIDPPQLRSVSAGLVRLVNDALKKYPAQRIQSAGDFVTRCLQLEDSRSLSANAAARIITALSDAGCQTPTERPDVDLFDDEETRVASRQRGSDGAALPPSPDDALVEGIVSRFDSGGIAVKLSDGTDAVIAWTELIQDIDDKVVVSLKPGQRIRARLSPNSPGNGNGKGPLHLTGPINPSRPGLARPSPLRSIPPTVIQASPVKVNSAVVSARARTSMAIVLVIVLVVVSLMLIGGKIRRHLIVPQNLPGAAETNPPSPVKFTAQVGQEAEATTDLNIRENHSPRSRRVGLVEKGSRVRILAEHRNWRRVLILKHGRDKEEPESEDEGWVDSGNLKAVDEGQV